MYFFPTVHMKQEQYFAVLFMDLYSAEKVAIVKFSFTQMLILNRLVLQIFQSALKRMDWKKAQQELRISSLVLINFSYRKLKYFKSHRHTLKIN